MPVDYKKLWILLIEKNISKPQLRKAANISPSTFTKLNKNEFVAMDVLVRICMVLDCDIGDVVFVNGCFWHAHEGCKWFVPPKSNTEFWEKKFQYNRSRDKENYLKLRALGWKVIIIWECEIRHGNPQVAFDDLIKEITNNGK